jgi:hypothetical protein
MKASFVFVGLCLIAVTTARTHFQRPSRSVKPPIPGCHLVATNGVYLLIFDDPALKLTGDPHHDMNMPHEFDWPAAPDAPFE